MSTTEHQPINTDYFNRATLKLEGAQSLVSALGILIGEALDGPGEVPISGMLLNSAMVGIQSLIESAVDDLSEDQKTKVEGSAL